MKNTKFYRCEHCGNIITKMYDSGISVVCCGDVMALLKPQMADSTNEKHVPIINIIGNDVTVTVGSTLHPMEEKHYIQWIYLETEKGGQFHYFHPGDEPIAKFRLAEGEKVTAAYEYCNIHKLWKALV
ncbi:MAG: desulfoferrodoxin family protein [Bacteroidales bacterium]